MDIGSYIVNEGLILIPALYIVGMMIKSTPKVQDWLIPYILGALGIAGAVGLMGISVNSVIQGVLIAGAAVYTNQLIKQATTNTSDSTENTNESTSNKEQ